MGAVETVTVVFTDLVDSTGLLARHGPAAMDRTRQEHFTLLRRAVGGAGREVKNLGDGLMVVFTSASTGVDAAVAMQQAIARSQSPDGQPIGLRVGLAVGDAETAEGDYFGPPVVEAARLCAQAGAGEILTTELVRVLAGGRGGHQFAALGEVTLKGFSKPVAVNRLVWAPAPDRVVPLPTRLAAVPAIGVHGREGERGRIGELLKEALDGERRVVFIVGEAGIGKTTLCGLIARRLHEDGATVLYGRCDEGLAVPYRPWVEALGELATAHPDVEMAPQARGELARLVPTLGEPNPGDGDQYLLFAAVREVLAACAPVVVVLDDLHWADAPSVQLLRHVIVNELGGFAVVATLRHDEVTSGSPLAELLASTHREMGVERLELRGLDGDSLARLMESAAGHPLTDVGLQLRDALLAETDGNPFFVGELLRHLAETGGIVREPDGRWTVTAALRQGGLPVSVREVIGQRVARLGPEVEQCLATASVIGREFELTVLAAVMNRPDGEMLDIIEAAAGASLVVELEPGRFSFAHALIEHALYGALSATRRAKLHGQVGEAIEALTAGDTDERAGELAHHWLLARGLQAEAKALGYAQAAGQRALRQVAPADAAAWFEQARALLDRRGSPDGAAMMDVLIGLGAARRQTGDTAHRETLLDATERALALGDTERAVRAVLANSRGWASQVVGLDRERVAGLERTLAAVGEADSPERARLLSVLAREYTYVDSTRAQQYAEESLTIADRLGDERLVLDALVGRGQATIRPDNARARLAEADRAVEIAHRLGDPFSEYLALSWMNLAAMQLTDLDRTLASFERARQIADRVREPTMLWLDEWHAFTAHALEGDLPAAEQDIVRSTQVSRETGQPDSELVDLVLRVILGLLRGDPPELDGLAREMEPFGALFRSRFPVVLAMAGRLDEAQARYRAYRDAGFPCANSFFWLPSMCDGATAAVMLDDPVGAAVLYEHLGPNGDDYPYTGQASPHLVGTCLGELAATLGRYDAAEGWFERAEAVARRLRSPYHLARVFLGRGAMRVRRDGHLDAARADLEEALVIAERHGFAQIARDATAPLAP